MLDRRRHSNRVFAYFILELIALATAFFGGYHLRARMSGFWGQSLEPISRYLWLLPMLICSWSPLLWMFKTYEGFRTRTLLMHAVKAALVCAMGTVLLYATVTLFKLYYVNRSLIGSIGLISFASLFLLRLMAMRFLIHYAEKGYDRHYVIIAGTPEDASALAAYLERLPGRIYQIQGVVTEAAGGPASLSGPTILGTLDQLPAIASRIPVDEIFLLPSQGPIDKHLDLILQCESMGIAVSLRIAPFDKIISRMELLEAAGQHYLHFATSPKSNAALMAKRMCDLLLSVTLLLLCSPLLILMAILVRLTSRGPAIFRQERAGMNGRVFTLYKLRSMVDGAEKDRASLETRNEMDGPVFKIRNDPRITPLGRFLRRTSIDELPQLWNVIKGDMSLVGPRPLPLYEVEKFERWQRRRMSMRPGITCLWQVSGRNRVASFSDWMKLDLDYVDRWSLGLDIKILLKTIPAVFEGRGAY